MEPMMKHEYLAISFATGRVWAMQPRPMEYRISRVQMPSICDWSWERDCREKGKWKRILPPHIFRFSIRSHKSYDGKEINDTRKWSTLSRADYKLCDCKRMERSRNLWEEISMRLLRWEMHDCDMYRTRMKIGERQCQTCLGEGIKMNEAQHRWDRSLINVLEYRCKNQERLWDFNQDSPSFNPHNDIVWSHTHSLPNVPH